MQISSDGYSSEYSAYKTREFARASVRTWEYLKDETGADCIMVRGHSGMSIAHAMLMLSDFPLVHLRKSNDNSHGSPLEGTLYHNMRRVLILDDFISSGATIRGMVQDLRELAKSRWEFYEALPEIVGVLQYKRSMDGERGRFVYGCTDDGFEYEIPRFGTL